MITPDSAPSTFLGLPQHRWTESDVAILPLPFERTVSYGTGTADAPSAVIHASNQVELWDDELNFDLDTIRIHTADPVVAHLGEEPSGYLRRVEQAATHKGSTLTVGIGGEHSVTAPLVRAVHGSGDLHDLTVVQIDAHSDLRYEHDGTVHSHACAMRRLTDAGASLVAIGIRAMSRKEAEYASTRENISIYRAQSLANGPSKWVELLAHLTNLKGRVYLTVDVDGLCPTLCLGTGTPEPGGLEWWPTLSLLRSLVLDATEADLIGCDFVETTPMPGTQINEFTTARLIAKLLAYRHTRGALNGSSPAS